MADSNRFFEGLVVGGLFGFLIGMLAAPKSGAEMRKQLADGSEDLYNYASDSFSGIKGKTEQAFSDLQAKSSDVIKKASGTVQATKEQIASKLQELAGQSTQVLVDDVESMTSG